MASLGSEKRPLILRFNDESRAMQVAEFCQEQGWHYIMGLEPGAQEDLSDLQRKVMPSVRRETPKLGRNEPCGCGSGRKFKKCCALAVA